MLEETLVRLDEKARFVLSHAAFLSPDFVMLDWLRQIAAASYAELDPTLVSRSQADPWLDVWRQLRGLRLLTPSEDVAAVADEQAMRRGVDVPQVARVHRLIAAHIVSRLSEEDKNEHLDRIEQQVFRFAEIFQNSWQHDAGVHWQVRPLAENGLHLLEQRPSSQELAMACGVAGQAEMALGQLILAGQLISACATALRQGHEANPQDADAARLHSTALSDLGDFYLRRGASGDAERALAQFEESLRMDQQLYEANPNSAQAAHDVSVSLNRLGAGAVRGVLSTSQAAVRGEPELGPGGARRQCVAEPAR